MPPYRPYVSKDFPVEGSFLRLDDKEKAWNEIDGRMRTAIRKARQSNATVKKVANTKANVEKFVHFCLNPDDIPATLTDRYHLYLGELDKKVIAAILVVEVGNKLFMLCHASVPEAKKINLPSLLIWTVVEEFTGSKFRVLDIGTSYRASLQTFFSGWRTQPYPMIMQPPELKPSLLLTPFDTAAMGTPLPADAEAISRKAMDALTGRKPWTFFPRAMYGLFTIIKSLKNDGKIGPKGTVWVTTTTETHYVSSCVTSAIEQTCPVTRKLTSSTAAILAIHEFGFPHPKLEELRKIADERKIPLIEDCAYSLGTTGTGTTGDYVLYSLTKAFPVQFGGIIVGRNFTHEELWKGYGCSDKGKEEYTLRMLAPWIGTIENSKTKRREAYQWYESIFGADRTFFPLTGNVNPGAFVLKMADEKTMEETSAFVRRFGTECGNYWKNGAIILPVHQRLEAAHREYIAGSVLATEREWCGVPNAPHGTHH
jgi:hypothetical protein